MQNGILKEFKNDILMEELMWKCIDGLCTPEEKLMLDEALKADMQLRKTYEAFFSMDELLKNQHQVDMSDLLKTRIETDIVRHFSKKQVPSVFPVSWMLITCGIFGIFICIAFYFAGSPSNFGFVQQIDPRIMSMVGWITLSILALLFIDANISKFTSIRKHAGFVV